MKRNSARVGLPTSRNRKRACGGEESTVKIRRNSHCRYGPRAPSRNAHRLVPQGIPGYWGVRHTPSDAPTLGLLSRPSKTDFPFWGVRCFSFDCINSRRDPNPYARRRHFLVPFGACRLVKLYFTAPTSTEIYLKITRRRVLRSFVGINFFEIKEIDKNHMWIYFYQSTLIFGKRYPPKPYGFDSLRLYKKAQRGRRIFRILRPLFKA